MNGLIMIFGKPHIYIKFIKIKGFSVCISCRSRYYQP